MTSCKLSSCASAVATTLLLAAASANASPPDAGQTLRQLQSQPTLPNTTTTLELQAPANSAQAPGGAQFTLTRVQLTGATLPAEELTALVEDAYGQQLDLAGLNALADRITNWYRAHGYPFALALVPAQTLTDGEVTIQIVEGRYGRVSASGASAEDAASWLTRLQPGAPITHAPLERSLRVLSSLPGVTVSPVMQPGQATGEGDLDVEITQQRFGGAVGLNNHGNRYTGRTHVSANAWAGGLLAFGDRVTLDGLLTTESLWLGALNYELPLGTDGLRAHAGYAHTHYELGEEFSSLDASGHARIASAGLSYPLLLTAQGGLEARLTYQHKWLRDAQGVIDSTTNKSSDSFSAQLRFDWRDGFLGGGLSWGGVTYTRGYLSLDDTLAAIDANTARTRGNFDSIGLDLSRLQRIAGPVSLYTMLLGQWASKNLDSSERFGLGGVQGVRAYPAGEGFGDEGALLQVELRYSVGDFTPYGFYDAGRIRVNDTPWAIGNNRRDLGGAGVGLRWGTARLSADANVAWRTRGGAPESDIRDPMPRAWAGMTSRF